MMTKEMAAEMAKMIVYLMKHEIPAWQKKVERYMKKNGNNLASWDAEKMAEHVEDFLDYYQAEVERTSK